MSKGKTAKPPYKKPKVVALGRLEKLTQAKNGTKSDGAGKPASRLNGPSS